MNSSLNINLFVNEEGENIYQLDTDFRVYAFVLKRRHILFREHQNQTLGSNHSSVIFYATLVSDSVSPRLSSTGSEMIFVSAIRCGVYDSGRCTSTDNH